MSQSAHEEFRGRIRGTVVQPGDPGFDEARRIWNGMIDRRPALLVRCSGVADVRACVEYARDRRLPLSIRGGGHNIAGLSVCDDGLVIDLAPMRGVWVDPAQRWARAQAGCLLGDVDRETQVHGLAAVMGFVSNTGIAGLTLGGGFGYLSRRFGWTSDTVRAMEVVTADGRVVRADARENADLFWALRGGGGNFGVVTSFEYDLFPVGPEVVAGAVAWGGDDAATVLDMYQRFAHEAPHAITCAAVLRPAPPAPWLPASVHGKPVVVLVACHSGTPDQGEKDLAPLKRFGSPVGDIMQRRTYVSQQCLLDATQPKGRRYYWKSEYLPALEPATLVAAMQHAASIPSPHGAVILFPIGGALNQRTGDHSAVGNRDAHYVLNITAAWDDPKDDALNIEWARTAWRDMRRFSTGGTYVNFLTEEEGDDRTRAAYGTNYDRLVAVKSKWDPDNLFRMNKNVTPREA